ncbi:cytochrome b/b6 domain-containing protein [Sphingobium sp. DEHP117]|uniref:cytochrome b/b6 domain-containing protein n=1 Tax=Sphingobium sp. DEHP117 TaxID=2993436 RepID=UPI0027D58495|nr:cytochrome b/b6 domain-containing protein [Sphingobium sp. DEHP117]MDQ4419497.1 cytochrome b/b6 domain-containing protein [Sphingobium sp. DEHP117]
MTEATPTRRWDPLVKLTHWAIASAILANAVVTEEGSSAHVWVGYALAAILALRLLWGLVGPAEARFSAFPPSPGKALSHIRDIRAGRHAEHRSHNPVGALMVYAIWGTLLVVIASGVSMAGLPGTSNAENHAAVEAGQTVGDEEGDEETGINEESEGEEAEESPGEDVHEAAVNLLYVLILAHVAGVIFESRRQKRNLALAMLPGCR